MKYRKKDKKKKKKGMETICVSICMDKHGLLWFCIDL